MSERLPQHSSVLQKAYNANWRKCYDTDNNFAYLKDVCDQIDAEHASDKSDSSMKKRLLEHTKIYNFAPTYDRWCITCGAKNVSKRCSQCRSVFFCNVECQRKAWRIHKHHCQRCLFRRCLTCGEAVTVALVCEKCPVQWCSEECKAKLRDAHTEYDCDYFAETFGK